MNRTKVILSIFLMLFLLLAGLVLPSFWKKPEKKKLPETKAGNRQRKQQKQILIPPCRNIWILML